MFSFISYAREDSTFAKKLAASLEQAGASVWIDTSNIRPGQSWDEAVETALDGCDHFVVVLSQSSVGSRHVRDEIAYALDEGKLVIPVLMEDCKIPLRLKRAQYVDLSNSFDAGIQRIIGLIKPAAKKSFIKRKRLIDLVPTILNEDFADNRNNWLQQFNDDYSLQFGHGRYIIEHKRDSRSVVAWVAPNFKAGSDVKFETTLQKMHGVDNFGYGLIWDIESAMIQHQFTITGDGHYNYGENTASGWKSVIEWTKSPHIQNGNAVNRLAVSRKAGQLTFSINGIDVNSVPAPTVKHANVGFIAYRRMRVEAHSLLVTYI